MKQNRMLEQVKEARWLPPILLAILFTSLFITFGQMVAQWGLEAILGVVSYFIPNALEFFYHYSIYISLASFAFIAALVLVWVRLVENRPLSSLGLYQKGWHKELGKGILFGFLQFSLIVFLMLVFGIGSLEVSALPANVWGFLIGLIPFWLLQGGTEELLTRGWLFPVVSFKSNRMIGIAVSAGIFGLLHLGNAGVTVLSVLNIVLYGIFACLVVLYSDNIWILAGLHGIWNFAQGNVYGYLVSGNPADVSVFLFIPKMDQEWLTGGSFGAEGSLVTSFVLMLSICLVSLLLKKRASVVE